MKNLKLTNLERMQENEMTQVRGGIFGMGKKYLKHGKPDDYNGSACWCGGSCSDADTRKKTSTDVRNGISTKTHS